MNSFKTRKTDRGIYRSAKWYRDNPFYQAGYQLPNCTCYAWGRFWEIIGTRPRLPLGDAGTWYSAARRAGIYKTGTSPRPGAVICWGKDGGAGHVAVVEEIRTNGTLLVSQSGWYRPVSNYPPDSPNYFWCNTTDKRYRLHWMDSRYHFQGFIYPPAPPVPPVQLGVILTVKE